MLRPDNVAIGALAESNCIADDYEALRARLRLDGYVFVRGLIDPDVVAAAGTRAAATLVGAGWTHSDATAKEPTRSADIRDPGYRAIAMSPGVNRLPYEPGPQRLMELLAGVGAFVYPVKVPRVVYPDRLDRGHKGRFVHQDYNVIGKQDMFTMWMPLQEIPHSLGPLAVLPGSSRRGWSTPHRLSPAEPGWVTAHFQPGDVLIFHCLTWHAALPNTTDQLRLSVDARWQLAQEPVPRSLLQGPLQRRDGGELFARVFSNQRWWHPVPYGLYVTESVAPPPGALVPPSRYVDFPDGLRQLQSRTTH